MEETEKKQTNSVEEKQEWRGRRRRGRRITRKGKRRGKE